MIDAKELRIGSWIKYGFNKEWVDDVKGKAVQVDIGILIECDNKPQYYDPIPLTPEILEKCGFEYEDLIDGYLCDNVPFVLQETNNGFVIQKMNEWTTIFKPITSLHQLQNLYFALTGTELNYTP